MLPKSILDDINKVCMAFLRSGNYFSSKSGNVAWEKVCSPKKLGGLGVRRVGVWNLAAMAKYAWAKL